MKITAYIAVLTLAIAPLHGAVITESVDFSFSGDYASSYLKQFDTSLGELTSITLNWTLNTAITTANLTNQSGATATVTSIDFNQAVSGGFFDVADGIKLKALALNQNSLVTLSDGGAVLNNGDVYSYTGLTFDPVAQQSYIQPSDAIFDYFKGTGSVPVYLQNGFWAVPFSGSDGVQSSSVVLGDTTSHLTATYTYNSDISAVPEPSALILGCGGLLFMASLATKKSQSTEGQHLSGA